MISDWLEKDGDADLLPWLWKGLLSFMSFCCLFAFLGCLKAPYGRYSQQRGFVSLVGLTSFKVSTRFGWMFEKIPCVVIPLYLVLNVGGRYVGAFNPNIILLGMFLLHYINRTFIYGLTLRGRNIPLASAISGFCVCGINGYLQGRYLTNYTHYDISWFYDPRFLAGQLLFLTGMAINIYSDSTLKSLRSPGETNYKIPHGGLFDYVSCANYFGEALEWTGYAIACWNPAAAQFAIWTTLFLCSRSLQHHRFYQDKFEDYPKSRKAFIPFVL